jgi:hypothetical protein
LHFLSLNLLLHRPPEAAMFLYPEHAKVERVLPKNKIYGHAQPTRGIRQRFVSEVDEIVWRYKLAPETLRLPVRSGVEEIQIFQIALKTGILREDVLRTIDRAIPSLLFFELTFQGQVRFAAAYKRLSEGGSSQPVVNTCYYETLWQDASGPQAPVRQPLPVALDMGGLYEQMLRQHMLASPLGLASRPGETLPETVERGNQIRAKRRECEKLEVKLRKEIQFNRRVEVNAALRQSLAELEAARHIDNRA